MRLTVALALRSGGQYTAEHARTLAAAAMRYGADRVVCLTDRGIGSVPSVVMRHNWPGWWSKLEVFRPGLFEPDEKVLFLDLDTLILKPFRSILTLPTPLFGRDASYKNEPCSTFILFEAGQLDILYETFCENTVSAMDRTYAPKAPNRVYGDQVFMAEVMRNNGIKWHWLQDRMPHCLSFIWSTPAVKPETMFCAFGAEWKPWKDEIDSPSGRRFKGKSKWWTPVWREAVQFGDDFPFRPEPYHAGTTGGA